MTKYLLIIIAFIGSLAIEAAKAQAPAIQWQKTYGSVQNDTFPYIGDDNAYSIAVTPDKGYIINGLAFARVTGDKTVHGIENNDYWVIKLDSNGAIQWQKAYGTLQDDWGKSALSAPGGYVIAGESFGDSNGNRTIPRRGAPDNWILKLNSAGNILWQTALGGPNENFFGCIAKTSDNGYIIGSYSNSGIGGDKSQASRGNYDYWIIKIDSNGTKAWDKTYGGSDEDHILSIQQTKDGGYIAAGYSWSGMTGDKTQPSKGECDYWIIKLNSTGNLLWQKSFGGDYVDQAYSIQQTYDGGYIAGGLSSSGAEGDKTQSIRGNYDSWVIKLDSAGNKIWDKTIGGSLADSLVTIKQTRDSGYIMAVSSRSAGGGDKTVTNQGMSDYWIVRLNKTGNILWQKNIGGNKPDVLTDLQLTADTGYVMCGYSLSGISGDKTDTCRGGYDYWIVKLKNDNAVSIPYIAQATSATLAEIGTGTGSLEMSVLNAGLASYAIYDLNGKTIETGKFSNSHRLLLHQGMYIVCIEQEGNMQITKAFVR